MTDNRNLEQFAAAVGADVKQLTAHIGNLTALRTDTKTNLVSALNEVLAAAQSAASSGGAQIDNGNAQSDISTLSARAIGRAIQTACDTAKAQAVAAAKNEILGGEVAAELDTLRELAAELQSGKSVAAALTQKLTEHGQRLDNIDAALGTDLVGVYNRAKAAQS